MTRDQITLRGQMLNHFIKTINDYLRTSRLMEQTLLKMHRKNLLKGKDLRRKSFDDLAVCREDIKNNEKDMVIFMAEKQQLRTDLDMLDTAETKKKLQDIASMIPLTVEEDDGILA